MRTNLKRQFNYTGRVRLKRKHIKLVLLPTSGQPPRVVVDSFGLDAASVPHATEAWLAARVVLEANRHTTSSFSRVDVGSVADVMARAVPQYSASLEEFDSETNIVFTVKVVSPKDGRLLAEAKNVRAENDPAGRSELLPLQTHDLGQETWRIQWEDGVGPILQINSRLLGADNFLTRDSIVKGVVLPAAFRAVLIRLATEPDLRRGESWAAEWMRYATAFASGPAPDDDDEGNWELAERWVNGVIRGFCERFSFTDRINEMLLQGPIE